MRMMKFLAGFLSLSMIFSMTSESVFATSIGSTLDASQSVVEEHEHDFETNVPFVSEDGKKLIYYCAVEGCGETYEEPYMAPEQENCAEEGSSEDKNVEEATSEIEEETIGSEENSETGEETEDFEKNNETEEEMTFSMESAEVQNVVAQVGETTYGTLQEAINAANNNEIVTLTANVTEDITINEAKNITMDLAGYTLISTGAANKAAISNQGIFTLVDTVGSGAVQSAANSSYYVIDNQGTMILGRENAENNFSVNALSDANTASIIRNGWDDNLDKAKEAPMTIYGGTYTGNTKSSAVIKNSDYGNLYIVDGSFIQNNISSGFHTILSYGKLMINGGLFEKEATKYAQYCIYVAKSNVEEFPSTAIINGGSFTVGGASASTTVHVATGATLNVYGGTHNTTIPSVCIPEGYMSSGSSKNGYTIVGPFAAKMKMTAGGKTSTVGYESISEAINKAVEDNGKNITITLLRTIKECIDVPSGMTLTFDLNGYILTNQGINDHTIDNKGTLSIKGSTTDSGVMTEMSNMQAIHNSGVVKFTTTKCYSFFSRAEGTDGYVIYNEKDANMNFNMPVTIMSPSTNSSCICNFGSLTLGGNSSADDPKVDSAYIAVINNKTGVLNITGGTAITGYDQTIQNWNDATISGGTMNGTVSTWAYSDQTEDYAGNTIITGGTITGEEKESVLVCWYTDSKKAPQVSISGGTINGTMYKKSTTDGITLIMEEENVSNGKIEVSGGTFNQKVPEAFCADGYVPTQETEGKYTVEALNENNATASIVTTDGKKYYGSIQTAIKAAEDGQTIILLKDVTLEDQAHVDVDNKGKSDNPIIFDLNGHDIVGNNTNTGVVDGTDSCGILRVSGSYMKLTDNSDGVKGQILNNASSGKVYTVYVHPNNVTKQSGELIIDGGVIIENKSSSGAAVYVHNDVDKNANVKLTINDTVIQSAGYTVRKDVSSGYQATAVINGGSYKSTGSSTSNKLSGTVTLNGGTFYNWSTTMEKADKYYCITNSEGEYSVTIRTNEPESYTAAILDKRRYLVDDTNLYDLVQGIVKANDKAVIKVKSDVSYDQPAGGVFGASSGAPKTITFDLEDNVTLSGKMTLQLSDVIIIGNGKSNFTCSAFIGYKMTTNGEDRVYSCRLNEQNLAIEATLNGVTKQYKKSEVKSVFAGGTNPTRWEHIKLYQDISYNASYTVMSDVIFDLNGHTYTYTSKSTGSTANGLLVKKGAQMLIVDTSEIKGGKIIVPSTANAAIGIQEGCLEIQNGVTIQGNSILLDGVGTSLTVFGAIDTRGTSNTAIMGNGSGTKNNTTIIIKEGAQILSDQTGAIYHPQEGELNIEGGTINGYSGIYMKSGKLSITGGTISGTGEKRAYISDGGAYVATGDAIVLDACGYPGGTPSVESMTGVTVISDNADAVACYNKEGTEDIANKNFITGGIYSNDITNYLAPGLEAKENSSQQYEVGKAIFTIAPYSSLVDGNTVSIANVSGGGSSFYYEDSVTLIAEKKTGYDFKGWYTVIEKTEQNGTITSLKYDQNVLSGNLTYTFNVKNNMELVAVYEATAKVTLKVSGTGFKVNDVDQAQNTYTNQFNVGTQITVESTNDKFYQWTNSSNKIVSKEKSYTFTIVTDTDLVANTMADNVSNSTALVEFISYYDQVIEATTWNTLGNNQLPAGPSKMGCTFKYWSMDGNTEATVDSIKTVISGGEQHIVLRPVYGEATQKYNVTIQYPDGTTQEIPETAYGNGVIVTAKDIKGKVFSHWADAATDGNILSYSKLYFIRVCGETTLYAIYVEEGTKVEAKPTIAMTNKYASIVDGKNKVSFTATRDIPKGYTLIEQGLLYSVAENCDTDVMQIGKDNIKKYISPNTALQGVTTLNVIVGNDIDKNVCVRGYMIVINQASGNIMIIYSDQIFSGSFNSLKK